MHDVRLGGSNIMLSCVLILVSVICYAVYLLASGELFNRIDSLGSVAYAICMSSAACIVQFFLIGSLACLMQAVYGMSLVNALFCAVLPVFLTIIIVQCIDTASAS